MATNKLSTLWTNFTTDIVSISIPLVAWETRIKEIFQLTPEDLTGATPVPATYRTYVNPVDLNDLGAAERDVAIGYDFMSYFGDVYSIIAVNEDGSIDISDILLCGYCPPSGRPAMIYSLIATVPTPKPPIVTTTRWVEEALSCIKSGGDNTGIQIGTNRKQQYNTATSTWEYTGEEEPISRTNLSACPLPEPPAPPTKKAYKSVGKSAATRTGELEITPYAEYTEITITNSLLSGTNRQYISIPVGKYLHVRNRLTTLAYTNTGVADNKGIYANNHVWESSNMFATTNPTTFYITINDTP